MKSKIFLASLLLSFGSFQTSIFAQGTAFTYQGRLNDGSVPANGNYDLRFAIYDLAASGSAVGNSITNSATSVSNGLFTVMLDFGDQFPGADRWLEIAVRTNGGASFIALTPRQQLTSVPYAVTAANVTGAINSAQLPGSVVTNGASNVSVSGTFSGNGSGLTSLSAASLTGTLADARLSTNVALLNRTPQNFIGSNTFTSPLTLSNSVQPAERLRLSGQEFYAPGVSSRDGISLLLGVNRVDNRQLWIADSARLAQSPTNAVLRLMPRAHFGAFIDAIATDGLTLLPLWLGPNSMMTLSNGNVRIAGTLIGGGSGNTLASGLGESAIVAGNASTILSEASFIGSGFQNTLGSGAALGFIGGGAYNQNLAYGGVIAGGQQNVVNSNSSFASIVGGVINTVNAAKGTIAGGQFNTLGVSSDAAFIGAGSGNYIGTNSGSAAIVGGNNNSIDDNTGVKSNEVRRVLILRAVQTEDRATNG